MGFMGLWDGTPAERTRDMPYKDFDNIEDPWEYLNAVRTLEMADRPQHIERWIDLVNKRPHAEQDALTTQGKDVWNYRMDTVREALKQRRAVAAGDVLARPSVVTDDLLAEMIYNPAQLDPPCQYLVHRFDRPHAPPEVMQKLTVGKVTYVAPVSLLVEKEVVKVPTGIEEYLDEATLFRELEDFVRRYVQLGERRGCKDGRTHPPGCECAEDIQFRRLLCCYVLVTWVYDRFTALPYLRALGDFDSGKSRLLQVVGWVCYRPAAAGGAATAASLFRMADYYRGTLIIDEADYDRSEMSEGIIKILNSGYQLGFPIWRAERDGAEEQFSVKVFDCYGPKILATRRRFRDAALESRCLSHTMPVITDLSREVPLSLGRPFYQDAARLRNKLLLWRFRWWRELEQVEEHRIEGVEPRVNQIIQPLLAVGDENLQAIVMGLVQSYVTQVQEERRRGVEGAVLAALIQNWIRRGRPDRFPMKTVTESVRNDHGLSSITDRKVGSVLDGLNVPKEAKGGIAWLKPTEEGLRNLCRRFGISLEDYELTASTTAPRPGLPSPTV